MEAADEFYSLYCSPRSDLDTLTLQGYIDFAFVNMVLTLRSQCLYFGNPRADLCRIEVLSWLKRVHRTVGVEYRPQAAGKYFEAVLFLIRMKQASTLVFMIMFY